MRICCICCINMQTSCCLNTFLKIKVEIFDNVFIYVRVNGGDRQNTDGWIYFCHSITKQRTKFQHTHAQVSMLWWLRVPEHIEMIVFQQQSISITQILTYTSSAKKMYGDSDLSVRIAISRASKLIVISQDKNTSLPNFVYCKYKFVHPWSEL